MHNSFKFDEIAPHLLRLSNSIYSLNKLSSQEWPEQWTQSFEVFSALQGNGDDCGIFTILNAYYVPRGVDRPPIVRETQVSNFLESAVSSSSSRERQVLSVADNLITIVGLEHCYSNFLQDIRTDRRSERENLVYTKDLHFYW